MAASDHIHDPVDASAVSKLVGMATGNETSESIEAPVGAGSLPIEEAEGIRSILQNVKDVRKPPKTDADPADLSDDNEEGSHKVDPGTAGGSKPGEPEVNSDIALTSEELHGYLETLESSKGFVAPYVEFCNTGNPSAACEYVEKSLKVSKAVSAQVVNAFCTNKAKPSAARTLFMNKVPGLTATESIETSDTDYKLLTFGGVNIPSEKVDELRATLEDKLEHGRNLYIAQGGGHVLVANEYEADAKQSLLDVLGEYGLEEDNLSEASLKGVSLTEGETKKWLDDKVTAACKKADISGKEKADFEDKVYAAALSGELGDGLPSKETEKAINDMAGDGEKDEPKDKKDKDEPKDKKDKDSDEPFEITTDGPDDDMGMTTSPMNFDDKPSDDEPFEISMDDDTDAPDDLDVDDTLGNAMDIVTLPGGKEEPIPAGPIPGLDDEPGAMLPDFGGGEDDSSPLGGPSDMSVGPVSTDDGPSDSFWGEGPEDEAGMSKARNAIDRLAGDEKKPEKKKERPLPKGMGPKEAVDTPFIPGTKVMLSFGVGEFCEATVLDTDGEMVSVIDEWQDLHSVPVSAIISLELPEGVVDEILSGADVDAIIDKVIEHDNNARFAHLCFSQPDLDEKSCGFKKFQKKKDKKQDKKDKLLKDKKKESVGSVETANINEELSTPSADEIERHGTFVKDYSVDESQVISNAGRGALWNYRGVQYEIITWNENAVEHEPGSQSVYSGPPEGLM
jgi:hypothetical protein